MNTSQVIAKRQSILLDLSNKCTLECPVCTRARFKEDNVPIPGHTMTHDEFEKITNYFHHIIFCGQLSDPVLHPHFINFLKILNTKKKQCGIRTAVSHRPISWYEKAFEANKQTYWIFGLDGLPTESHKYRIKQDGEKLFDVMKLAVSKNINVLWQYIIFKYNENHIEEARKLAESAGIKFTTMKSSYWTGPEDPYKPTDPNNYISEDVISYDIRTNKRSIDSFSPQCINGTKDGQYTSATSFGYSNQGYVLPCCMCEPSFAFAGRKRLNKKNLTLLQPLFNEKFNLSNVDKIEDIIYSEEWLNLFNTLLTDPENAPGVCKRFCGSGKTIKKTM
jgi:MoaA/NifB/PqqE/SkfB family radical SAM enzyme